MQEDHLFSVDECLRKHQTNQTLGLTTGEVAERQAKYGKNELTPPKTIPKWRLYVNQLTGFFAILLWIAAFLCIIAYAVDSSQSDNIVLAFVLVLVILLTGTFSYYQEAKSVEGTRSTLLSLLWSFTR